jgi:putative spermidine/putrescine transport system permease protein
MSSVDRPSQPGAWMNLHWRWILVPPLAISMVLLGASQFCFLRGSLYQDLGVGRLGDTISASNYVRIFSDTFYLASLWLTVKLSAIATFATLLFGFPVAYVLARMRSHWGSRMLALILAASFVTIVIKVLGLNLIFASSGGLNRMLMQTGLVHDPVSLLGTHAGVVVGLMHFSLAFIVVLLYSVVLTIPVSHEEAAQNLGASRWRVHWRVT